MLEASGLSKRFGGVTALSDVSFTLDSGDILGVIGPNGAGKTTLINIVVGLFGPDRGTLRLDGHDVTGAAPHRMAQMGVARTFQNVRLFAGMTALETVLVAYEGFRLGGLRQAVPWLGGAARRRSVQHAMGLLEMTGLAGRAQVPASQLPFSDQRRLEIARALALEPRYLLLDETAAGMSEPETRGLAEDILLLSRQGCAILLIEHDITLIRQVSTHVLALNFGQLLASGSAEEVLADPAVVQAYLGS